MQNGRFRASELAGRCFVAANMVCGGAANAGPWTPRSNSLSRERPKPTGEGLIKSVDAGERKLVIKHGRIRALQMPGMGMPFGVAPGTVDLGATTPGQR